MLLLFLIVDIFPRGVSILFVNIAILASLFFNANFFA